MRSSQAMRNGIKCGRVGTRGDFSVHLDLHGERGAALRRTSMKILVVSSHTLIGHSLVKMLSGLQGDEPLECKVVRAEDTVEYATTWSPDLIVVEATTDFAHGVTATRQVRLLLPNARIVVLGSDDDEATVYEAISAGADGYLTRDTSTEVLLHTLAGVLRGEIGLPRVTALRVIRQLRRMVETRDSYRQPDIEAKLTPREQDVFELVRRGLRSREIATALCIAEGTVYKHIHNILEKLNVHSRNQAVALALHDAGSDRAPPGKPTTDDSNNARPPGKPSAPPRGPRST